MRPRGPARSLHYQGRRGIRRLDGVDRSQDLAPARHRTQRDDRGWAGRPQQIPDRDHGRNRFDGGRAQGADDSSRPLAEHLAAVDAHAPALPRNSARMTLPRAGLLAALVLAPLARGVAQHEHHQAMPIPMPKGMIMLPGLMGLRPPVTPWLPGKGIDVSTLPLAKPSVVMRLKDGDTLDLTAMLVRRVINGNSFAMYGFNGMTPGPLIRVAKNATITVRFHNKIDLPSAIHWHGVRLDNEFDGVPDLTQKAVPTGGSFTYRVRFPDAGVYWYHPHVREDIAQALGLVGNMLVDSPERDYYSPVNREEALILSDLMVHEGNLVPYGQEG